MAGFGHVMNIFIGAGFPRMGFPGYIVCLYVVACNNVYFSLIIMLMLLTFNLTPHTIKLSHPIWEVIFQLFWLIPRGLIRNAPQNLSLEK